MKNECFEVDVEEWLLRSENVRILYNRERVEGCCLANGFCAKVKKVQGPMVESKSSCTCYEQNPVWLLSSSSYFPRLSQGIPESATKVLKVIASTVS
jgi:hypothetical protein